MTQDDLMTTADSVLFLNDSQLHELTGMRRYAAQRRVLAEMRIKHRVRPDGRPLVHPADLPVRGRQHTGPDRGAN